MPLFRVTKTMTTVDVKVVRAPDVLEAVKATDATTVDTRKDQVKVLDAFIETPQPFYSLVEIPLIDGDRAPARLSGDAPLLDNLVREREAVDFADNRPAVAGAGR